MHEFEPLIGTWHGTGEIPMDPPMQLSVEATVERLGAFVVLRSRSMAGEVPDSVSIIGGAPERGPQPMRYHDSRGVERAYLTTVEGSTWRIWFAPDQDWTGPHGPGFNQRFIGELSADGQTIDGRWERGLGEAGDQWELDFALTYVRRHSIAADLFAGSPVADYATSLAWYEQLLGTAPTFLATETEAVWEVGDHRWVYIEELAERPDGAMYTVLVKDLEAHIAEIAGRGLQPVKDETYDNGVRKVTYRDPDGNEIGFGPAPD